MTNRIPEQFHINSYSYDLPPKQIAQQPAGRRDHSRLLVLQQDNSIQHCSFTDITEYLKEGDLLVVNDTRVFPARLIGNKETGGKIEIFLLEYPQSRQGSDKLFSAKALFKASRRPKVGSTIKINNALSWSVKKLLEGGKIELELCCESKAELEQLLGNSGQIPLPPYITRENGASREDKKRYQTVYAKIPGAVAAPTAGLHFTKDLLEKIKQKGIKTKTITLHVGYGTFAPVRENDIRQHQIHSEYIEIPGETVAAVKKTRKRGRKIWAVGTTTVRALEYASLKTGELQETAGWCDLYIYPGFKFRTVDSIITNFHLPNSSLLFLVSAFCGEKRGREILLDCYQQAITEGYRFFSYGDAMAIPGPRSS